MMAYTHNNPQKATLSALVGEPEDQVRQRMVQTLGRRGLIVHQADSSSEVIHIARQRAIDFLMLDVDIPAMGGLNTYHLLKEVWHFVPCIFFARELTPEARRRALDEEAFSIIPKPLQTGVLEDTLDRFINRYFPRLEGRLRRT